MGSFADKGLVAWGRDIAAGRIYRGERSPSECYVYVLGPDGPEPLTARSWDPRASFSWGIPGVGAQELAWAVIRDATGDSRLADDWCADLSGEIVSRLPLDEFWLSASDMVAWLDASPVASAIGLRALQDSCERAPSESSSSPPLLTAGQGTRCGRRTAAGGSTVPRWASVWSSDRA
jgi:hypothetical protein